VLTAKIENIDFFSDQVQFSEKFRTHIDFSDSSDVTLKDFAPVHDYLVHGDFAPRLVEKPGQLPKISGVLLQEEKDTQAERFAKIFLTASQLQMAELRALMVKKLQALYPLSPLYLLIVVKICMRSDTWGCDAEGEMYAWLVDHIAEFYFLLVAQNGKQLVEILGESKVMEAEVMAKIAENPRACRKGVDDD